MSNIVQITSHTKNNCYYHIDNWLNDKNIFCANTENNELNYYSGKQLKLKVYRNPTSSDSISSDETSITISPIKIPSFLQKREFNKSKSII